MKINAVSNQNIRIKQKEQKNISFGRFSPKPIYAITYDCKVLFFSTTQEAIKKSQINYYSIENCVLDTNRTAGNLVFKRADSITNKEGQIDAQKVKKIADQIPSFCIINRDLSIQELGAIKTARTLLGITPNRLQNILNNDGIMAKDKILIRRRDIIDKYGNIDIEKAQKIQQERLSKRKTHAFYVVDKDLKTRLRFNLSNFAKQIGLTKVAASSCLVGKTQTVGGYTLIKPNLVEDVIGQLNPQKLREIANRRFYERIKYAPIGQNRIAAVNRNGEIVLFDQIRDASKATECSISKISAILAGKQKRPNKDYFFAKTANYLDENGKIDTEKLKDTAKKFFSRD